MRYLKHWNKETGQEEYSKVKNVPERCPYCRHIIEPEFMEVINEYEQIKMEAFFRCSKQECRRMFLGIYENRVADTMRFDTILVLVDTIPEYGSSVAFEKEIASLSPDFVKIYNQALEAEFAGLDEICGVGFRKALEFLIKDYLVSKDPEAEDIIKKKALGKCIADITDQRIRAMAKRATWLGNDETHYSRKWTSKNVSDLKILINLCVHWIAMELLTENLEIEMPD